MVRKRGMKRGYFQSRSFRTGLIAMTIALALIGSLIKAPAQAAFPDKPITVIVPFKAGGSTDTMVRVYAKALTKELGQPVVVQNRAGASGAVGVMYLKGQKPDGYTILVGNEQIPTWSPIHDKVAFTMDDFSYLGAITEYQQAIICSADKPYKTLEELIAYSKKDTSLTFADQGTLNKIVILFVAKQEGVDWRAVPTKGGGGMIPMLLGGQVDFAWSGGVHQRYGDKIRVLASCNSERLPQSPEAPALMEKYGIAMPGRVIIMGPKGIPDDRIEVLQAALKKATNDPAFIKMLKENLKFPQMFIAGEEVKKSLPGIIKKLEDMKEKMGM